MILERLDRHNYLLDDTIHTGLHAETTVMNKIQSYLISVMDLHLTPNQIWPYIDSLKDGDEIDVFDKIASDFRNPVQSLINGI